ncbi:tRNA pseudouridine synthase Pus10 [Candidatus Bilamarchaeum dharawalense]|uniref:tRNA pseudouridine(55) synthase n=1 Tax=Candidatus Bilamarchaeum dharawalense TaxID=2885759 RepID=A0A5E4LW49_9ARCH|nr:tRNA pseudouridine synthase Pus10 [Candidatus Bilamarchaeum dharawalense]
MELCQICNNANGSTFALGKCHICDGKVMETAKMVEKAVQLIPKDAVSFSISTTIPKDWQIREEKIWDIQTKKAESIKNILNRTVVAAVKKTTALRYASDGDCRLVFDYGTGQVSIQKNDLFIFGRYKKISSGLSQSRWKCSQCEGKGCGQCAGKGKYYESVEERIGEPIKTATEAREYVMHASGREDVDATNSAGRAFVVEVKEPNKRRMNLEEITKEIGKTGEVEVVDLKVVDRGFVEIVTESHFDKSYQADVEFGRELTGEDGKKIESLIGKTLLQQTPTRVAHRRANLVRHRKIKTIEITNIRKNYATIIVKAEAGTYIKELISGDNGRTKPSIAELLGTSAVCKKLEVTKIEDEFLDFILKGDKRDG